LVADFGTTDRSARRFGRVRDRGAFHILVNNTGGHPPDRSWSRAEAFVAAFRAHLVNNQIPLRP